MNLWVGRDKVSTKSKAVQYLKNKKILIWWRSRLSMGCLFNREIWWSGQDKWNIPMNRSLTSSDNSICRWLLGNLDTCSLKFNTISFKITTWLVKTDSKVSISTTMRPIIPLWSIWLKEESSNKCRWKEGKRWLASLKDKGIMWGSTWVLYLVESVDNRTMKGRMWWMRSIKRWH